MARQDGRVEKGQSIRSAFSAKAWNRAQDAADIVLGVQPGIEAGPFSTFSLPCVKAILRDKGYFGQVRVFRDNDDFGGHFSPTMPASLASIGSATSDEKKLVTYAFPMTSGSFIASSWAAYDLERRFAICIGNDSNHYALSGFAITRVRVTNKNHRMARLPIEIGQQSDQNAGGGLDSAWWGPARIIGYAEPYTPSNGEQHIEFSFPSTSITFPNSIFYWALVHF